MLSKLILLTLNIIPNIYNSESSDSESSDSTTSSLAFNRESLRFFKNTLEDIDSIPIHQLPGKGIRIRLNCTKPSILKNFKEKFNYLNKGKKTFVLTKTNCELEEMSFYFEKWEIKREKEGNNYKVYILINEIGNENILFDEIINWGHDTFEYKFTFLYKDENNETQRFISKKFKFMVPFESLKKYRDSGSPKKIRLPILNFFFFRY